MNTTTIPTEASDGRYPLWPYLATGVIAVGTCWATGGIDGLVGIAVVLVASAVLTAFLLVFLVGLETSIRLVRNKPLPEASPEPGRSRKDNRVVLTTMVGFLWVGSQVSLAGAVLGGRLLITPAGSFAVTVAGAAAAALTWRAGSGNDRLERGHRALTAWMAIIWLAIISSAIEFNQRFWNPATYEPVPGLISV